MTDALHVEVLFGLLRGVQEPRGLDGNVGHTVLVGHSHGGLAAEVLAIDGVKTGELRNVRDQQQYLDTVFGEMHGVLGEESREVVEEGDELLGYREGGREV